jgi:hypothetical protein
MTGMVASIVDITKALVKDFGLSGGDVREDNINRFMAHIGEHHMRKFRFADGLTSGYCN